MKRWFVIAMTLLAAAFAVPGAAFAQDKTQPAYMVGEWGFDAECSSTFSLDADGTFRLSDGTGRWWVENKRLITSFGGDGSNNPISKIEPNRIEFGGGQVFYRCDTTRH